MKQLRYQDLDFNLLWQRERDGKSWKSKGEEDWDKRATSFAKRTEKSTYINQFISLLQPDPAWSILDIGSGPGTLALPLASQVKQITCIDFSTQMLAILNQRAAKKGLSNILTQKLSWEDDWKNYGIQPHTVTIASRSLAVNDLRSHLERLCQYATEKVAITDRVQHGPFDPGAYLAIGRPLKTGPDYIFTLNLLYQMGYQASVDFIHLEPELNYFSFDEAFSSYTWMFRDLDEKEKIQLKNYVRSITSLHEDGSVTVHREQVPSWAFISWQP